MWGRGSRPVSPPRGVALRTGRSRTSSGPQSARGGRLPGRPASAGQSPCHSRAPVNRHRTSGIITMHLFINRI